MSGGVLATANRRRRSTVRRVERGVWAGREAEAQVGAVDQEPHAAPRFDGRFHLGCKAARCPRVKFLSSAAVRRCEADPERASDAATEQFTSYSLLTVILTVSAPSTAFRAAQGA